MQIIQTPSLATSNCRLLESMEQALRALKAATGAAAVLTSRLYTILPAGKPEAIQALLIAGSHQENAHEDDTDLECLIKSLTRRADALCNALTVTHDGLRL